MFLFLLSDKFMIFNKRNEKKRDCKDLNTGLTNHYNHVDDKRVHLLGSLLRYLPNRFKLRIHI